MIAGGRHGGVMVGIRRRHAPHKNFPTISTACFHAIEHGDMDLAIKGQAVDCTWCLDWLAHFGWKWDARLGEVVNAP